MKIHIEIENPNERESELISELSKIESEKVMEERRYMEDTLLTKMPNMFRDLSKKEQENSIKNMADRLIQENSVLRTELGKALQRIEDLK